MRVLFLSIVLICLSLNVFCQTLAGENRTFQYLVDQVDLNNRMHKKDLTPLERQQFLNPDWQAGNVILADSSIIDNLELRYNLAAKEIHFLKDNEIYAIALNNKISRITIGNKSFLYTGFKNEDIRDGDFFEIIVDDTCKLLLRRTAKFVKAQKAEAYKQPEPAKYEIREAYYLKRGKNPAFYIKTRKKYILNKLSDKETQLKKYIKSEKLRLSRRGDLIKLIIYYNNIK